MTCRLHTTVVALAFVLTWTPEVDASSGRDKHGRDKDNQTGKHQASIRTAAPVFSPNDRDVCLPTTPAACSAGRR
jgi:hypothetical protein